MNILILTHSYPDDLNIWRGSFVREQAVTLSTEHNVTVVYFTTDMQTFSPFGRPVISRTESGNLAVHTISVPRSFPVYNQLRYLKQTIKYIKKTILRETRIDLIHSHLTYPAGVLGVRLQETEGIPCVITEHSFIRKYFRSRIHKSLVTGALRKCKAVIPVSKALGEDIRKCTSNRIVVIPNVVDFDKFTVARKQRTDEISLGILGGYNDNTKGLDILIRAISLIGKPEYKVHVGGDGKILGEMKNLAKDSGVENNFIFHGTIDPDKLQEFYGMLDILVLPSRYETFGLVLAEAMCCGIPVIATRCGGPEEIVTPETGILVAKEDPDALASAIKKLSVTLENYDSLAIKNYACGKYGRGTFLKSLNEVYHSVIISHSA